jgi:hypothetical protein
LHRKTEGVAKVDGVFIDIENFGGSYSKAKGPLPQRNSLRCKAAQRQLEHQVLGLHMGYLPHLAEPPAKAGQLAPTHSADCEWCRVWRRKLVDHNCHPVSRRLSTLGVGSGLKK